MKKIIITLLMLWSAVAVGQKVLMEAGQRKALSDTSQSDAHTGAAVGWGDSMTFGFGATTPDSVWVKALQNISGYYFLNMGVSGETSTQIKTRFLARKDLWKYNTTIWAGRNNSTDSAAVVGDIKQMVDSLLGQGNDRYIVFTVMNRTDEPFGSGGFNNVAKINTGLFKTFPGHVFDVRRFIIDSYNPLIPADVDAYDDSIPPPSLMYTDPIHLNDTGSYIIAPKIYKDYFQLFTGDKVMGEVSWKKFFQAPRFNTDNNDLFVGTKFYLQNGYIGIDTRKTIYPLNIGWKTNPAVRIFGSTDDSVNISMLDIGFNSSYFTINAGSVGAGAVRPLRVGTNSGGTEYGQVISGLQKGISVFTGTANGNNTSIAGVYGSLTGGANNNAFAIVPTLTKTDVGSSGSINALWVSARKQTTSGAGDKNLASFGWNSADRGTGTDTAYATIDSAGNYVSNGGAFFGANKRIGFANSQAKKSNAIVQINSTTQGLIIPRMTAAQRLAISVGSGDSSLRVFDLDSIRTMEYSGSAWRGVRYTNESAVSSSGDYTPTVTNVANLISSSGETATYYRMGDKVHIDGSFSVSLTALVSTTINISMPFASNFTTITDAKGMCNFVATTSNGATVTADTTNDLITLNFTAVNTSGVVNFSLSYTVK